jgi:hypothetical protein
MILLRLTLANRLTLASRLTPAHVPAGADDLRVRFDSDS